MDKKNASGQRGYNVDDIEEITDDFYFKGNMVVTGNISAGSGLAPATRIKLFSSHTFHTTSSKRYMLQRVGGNASSFATNYAVATIKKTGKLLGIELYCTTAMGDTVFTLEDVNGGTLGTLTVLGLAIGWNYIDFTGTLDSGFNTFTGPMLLAIGYDPTNYTGGLMYTETIYEIDL